MATQTGTAKQLEQLIATLQDERQQHTDAIAEIDRTFARLGIAIERHPRRGRPPGTTAKKSAQKKAATQGRGRGRYAKTAEQFILDLLKNGKTPTTADINAAWMKAGRPGDAANTLTRLAKDGKIERENIPGARGSKYRKK